MHKEQRAAAARVAPMEGLTINHTGAVAETGVIGELDVSAHKKKYLTGVATHTSESAMNLEIYKNEALPANLVACYSLYDESGSTEFHVYRDFMPDTDKLIFCLAFNKDATREANVTITLTAN